MAKKTAAKYSHQKALASLMGFKTPWIIQLAMTTKAKEADVSVFYFAKWPIRPESVLGFKPEAWEWSRLLSHEAEWCLLKGPKHPVICLRPKDLKAPVLGYAREQSLTPSFYVRGRDLMGAIWTTLKDLRPAQVHLQFVGAGKEEILGALVGLELAHYSFRQMVQGESEGLRHLTLASTGKEKISEIIKEAGALGSAVNLARHLVNLPAQTLNPTSYAHFLKNYFKSAPGLKVEVWGVERLKRENMGLHLAVGAAGEYPPCLVHVSYRPQGTQKTKPLAFVGKGITFDSGGLDVKPPNAMRWMKKDMGGSAAVVGLCDWIVKRRLKVPCDFYVALAENAIASKAFRPGDVLCARSGASVEIHNTDAEGRLVLADALDVAVTQKQAPQMVIDVATLTGAIKVSLGTEVAGLFSNRHDLASRLVKCGQKSGDHVWHMPLIQKYRSAMRSTFADMNNAVDGFGGAVTAALFLQNFVKDVPWAHLDIYAWKDAAESPFSESGGSGQAVQCLSQFISEMI